MLFRITINSLVPERFVWHLRKVIWKLTFSYLWQSYVQVMAWCHQATGHYLSQLMLIQICVATSHHKATMNLEPLSTKWRTSPFCTVNIIAAADLATQDTRISATMVFTYVSRNIPLSSPKGLMVTISDEKVSIKFYNSVCSTVCFWSTTKKLFLLSQSSYHWQGLIPSPKSCCPTTNLTHEMILSSPKHKLPTPQTSENIWKLPYRQLRTEILVAHMHILAAHCNQGLWSGYGLMCMFVVLILMHWHTEAHLTHKGAQKLSCLMQG